MSSDDGVLKPGQCLVTMCNPDGSLVYARGYTRSVLVEAENVDVTRMGDSVRTYVPTGRQTLTLEVDLTEPMIRVEDEIVASANSRLKVTVMGGGGAGGAGIFFGRRAPEKKEPLPERAIDL